MTTRRRAESKPNPAANSPARFQLPREVVSELRKVVWPTREEAWRLTLLVIIISVAVGALLGVLDIGFSALVRRIFVG